MGKIDLNMAINLWYSLIPYKNISKERVMNAVRLG